MAKYEGISIGETIQRRMLKKGVLYIRCTISQCKAPEDMQNTVFLDCELDETLWDGCNMHSCIFMRCVIRKMSIVHANIKKVTWIGTDTSQVKNCINYYISKEVAALTLDTTFHPPCLAPESFPALFPDFPPEAYVAPLCVESNVLSEEARRKAKKVKI